ncbi:Glycosyl transferase family 2 [Arenibacter nanhaiticus]|uniref:Glycosyl transferase family 2 n=1 Tax=Arenibacter nanhaiticus TaxID=558155 RepID=A0A1M6ESE1_9FLAO|nr:glycosyltransferase family A protein [Arenibacter nanhaiticus]SHI88289.1 Glycosyl transferase family 2 [Arenibacter nanhaiticus]
MQYYIIIPAHNEALFLSDTLHSIVNQTLLPKKVVVVNDNSTDNTEGIIDRFIATYPFIVKLNTTSSSAHMPGSKVVNAFNKGLQLLDSRYDFIVKLDADIILPHHYFEKIASIFQTSPKIGIAGGFAYEEDITGTWKLNHPMDKDHVRGAFKAYTKNCFTAIGGLRNAMGWDTVDELLAQYHGFNISTDHTLHAKHLRPLGKAYNPKAKLLQGKAMFTMRYGFWITLIASLKMAAKQGKPQAFWDNIRGFLKAKKEKKPYLVNIEEGDFIRRLRWKKIKAKLFR